jgi:integrase
MEANMGRAEGGNGRQLLSGLIKRGGVWHIDKEVAGVGRICRSTGESDRAKAEDYLLEELRRIKEATRFGVRPARSFTSAATKFLEERKVKSAPRDAQDLKSVMSYIGDLSLDHVCDSTLEKFKADRLAGVNGKRVTTRTINRTIRIVNLVLRKATKWRDEANLTWLLAAPDLEQLEETDRRVPYPFDWEEQDLLYEFLPEHQRDMCDFGVNTGCREGEMVKLLWEWEFAVPELGDDVSVFVIPGKYTKNGKDKLVPLNRIARAAVDRQRGKHPTHVFTYEGKPVTKIYNSSWKRARKEASKHYEERLKRKCPDDFKRLRVHDQRHTFGRRLRAAGVLDRDIQDLMGHTSGRITSLYTAAEIEALIAAVEKIADRQSRKSPAMTLVRKAAAERFVRK